MWNFKGSILINSSIEQVFDLTLHIMRGMQEGQLIERDSMTEDEFQKTLEFGRRQILKEYNKPNGFLIETEDPLAKVFIKFDFIQERSGVLVTKNFIVKPKYWIVNFFHSISQLFSGSRNKEMERFLYELKYACESYN